MKIPQPPVPLRVLLVDDSPAFLAAARRYLATQPWARVIGSGTSADEALQLIEAFDPDLVLLDISLPQVSGIEVARAIKRLPNAPQVAMLTLYDNAEYRYHALEAGAIGYIVKSEMESTLPQLLESLCGAGRAPDALARSIVPARHQVPVIREAVQESEERLRLALEAGDIGIFDWNLPTGFIAWSPEHARLFGLRLDEFDGTYAAFAARVHPDDLPGIEQAVAVARQQRSTYRKKYRVIWPDGTTRWIHGKGRFSYDAAGEAIRMTGIVQDVTESMQTFLDLRDKQARLSAILDSNPQCIKLLSADGKVSEINRAGLAMLGIGEGDDIVGRTVDKFIAPEYLDQVHAFYGSILDGESGQFEFEIVRADGARRRVESHAVPLVCNGEIRALSVTFDITQRKEAEERLRFISHHDTLTRLPNRVLFTDRLQQAMLDVKRPRRPIAVVVLGLDRFKIINDTLGHEVGDAVLLATARRLSEAVHPADTVARFSGDEFAVLLANLERAEDATLAVQRILNAFRPALDIHGQELFVSVSLGATLYPLDDAYADAGTLLRNADTALYRAKAEGRSNCQFYTTEMTQRAHEDMALEHALRHAIERNELTLHFQPIVDLHSGRVHGVEALLRWTHPEFGPVTPARFIPIAEESGLIVPIGEWVLREACRQMRIWRDAGRHDLHVSVNISSRQFEKPDLAERILAILEETGLEGQHLELEITESMLLSNIESTIELMRRLDARGVRFAVDDFGTGYSSLSYLKRFPIDVLKIDQSFVRDITSDADDAAIVRAIVTLAHSLGMSVVAEGVETAEQVDFLCLNGCDQIQGYYFSRPDAAETISRQLHQRAMHALCEAIA